MNSFFYLASSQEKNKPPLQCKLCNIYNFKTYFHFENHIKQHIVKPKIYLEKVDTKNIKYFNCFEQKPLHIILKAKTLDCDQKHSKKLINLQNNVSFQFKQSDSLRVKIRLPAPSINELMQAKTDHMDISCDGNITMDNNENFTVCQTEPAHESLSWSAVPSATMRPQEHIEINEYLQQPQSVIDTGQRTDANSDANEYDQSMSGVLGDSVRMSSLTFHQDGLLSSTLTENDQYRNGGLSQFHVTNPSSSSSVTDPLSYSTVPSNNHSENMNLSNTVIILAPNLESLNAVGHPMPASNQPIGSADQDHSQLQTLMSTDTNSMSADNQINVSVPQSGLVVPSSIADISKMGQPESYLNAAPNSTMSANSSVNDIYSVPATIQMPYQPIYQTAGMHSPVRPYTYSLNSQPVILTPPCGSMSQTRFVNQFPNQSVALMPRLVSDMGTPRRSFRSMTPNAKRSNRAPCRPSKRRASVTLPTLQADNDCQIIAVQKRTEGVPVIQSVQGGNQNNTSSESTIHLSDSITLSVRSTSDKDHVMVVGNSSSDGDANAVANLLATRGITVTPASNQQNNNVDSHPKNSNNWNLSRNSQPGNSTAKSTLFAVPASKSQVSNKVDRPPRPPTVDLTHDENRMRNSLSGADLKSSGQNMCQICDRNFSTCEQLTQHMRVHRTSQGLVFQCGQCSASFTSQILLNQHKEQKHGISNNQDENYGIPIVDLRNASATHNLSRFGVNSFIPISSFFRKGDLYGLPVISLASTRNGMRNLSQEMGIKNVLALGPLKPLR